MTAEELACNLSTDGRIASEFQLLMRVDTLILKIRAFFVIDFVYYMRCRFQTIDISVVLQPNIIVVNKNV